VSASVRDIIAVNIDAMPDHVYQRDIRKQLCGCFSTLDHRYPCANHGDTDADIAAVRADLHGTFGSLKGLSARTAPMLVRAAYAEAIGKIVKGIIERNSGAGGAA
jgi:hypothetical protein